MKTTVVLPDPRASRPHMPKDYGIPTDEEGLLPWSHARERLERAQVYWVGTVSAAGRPHATPVWGVWMDNVLYFDGSPETRRGRNLAQNPTVVIHLDSGGDGKDVVIVEGEAREVLAPERSLTERIAAGYCAKYVSEGYAPPADQWDQGGLFRMVPRVAFAWTVFNVDSTRWHFDDEG